MPQAKVKPAEHPADADHAATQPGRPGSPEHEEWLLDESLRETFPASDPISPSARRPGRRHVDSDPAPR